MKTTPSKAHHDPPSTTPADFAGGSTGQDDGKKAGDADFEREGRFARSAGDGKPAESQGREPAVKGPGAPASGAGRATPSAPTAPSRGKKNKRA